MQKTCNSPKDHLRSNARLLKFKKKNLFNFTAEHVHYKKRKKDPLTNRVLIHPSIHHLIVLCPAVQGHEGILIHNNQNTQIMLGITTQKETFSVQTISRIES